MQVLEIQNQIVDNFGGICCNFEWLLSNWSFSKNYLYYWYSIWAGFYLWMIHNKTHLMTHFICCNYGEIWTFLMSLMYKLSEMGGKNIKVVPIGRMLSYSAVYNFLLLINKIEIWYYTYLTTRGKGLEIETRIVE